MQKIDLTITGTQTDGTTTDTITQNTIGIFARIANTFCLKYEEVSEEGEVTKTLLTFQDKKIEITKQGAVNSRISLLPQKLSATEYTTPFGTLHLLIDTQETSYELSDASLSIHASYRLFYGEECISSNILEITGVFV